MHGAKKGSPRGPTAAAPRQKAAGATGISRRSVVDGGHGNLPRRQGVAFHRKDDSAGQTSPRVTEDRRLCTRLVARSLTGILAASPATFPADRDTPPPELAARRRRRQLRAPAELIVRLEVVPEARLGLGGHASRFKIGRIWNSCSWKNDSKLCRSGHSSRTITLLPSSEA